MLAIIFMVLHTHQEEIELHTRFPDHYAEYCESTPGLNLPVGLIRWIYRLINK